MRDGVASLALATKLPAASALAVSARPAGNKWAVEYSRSTGSREEKEAPL
jgi:hypothetical protein